MCTNVRTCEINLVIIHVGILVNNDYNHVRFYQHLYMNSGTHTYMYIQTKKARTFTSELNIHNPG